MADPLAIAAAQHKCRQVLGLYRTALRSDERDDDGDEAELDEAARAAREKRKAKAERYKATLHADSSPTMPGAAAAASSAEAQVVPLTLSMNPDVVTMDALRGEATSEQKLGRHAFVVSVVGSTKVGKSFLLDALVGDSSAAGAIRPFHDAAAGGRSTTANGHVYLVPGGLPVLHDKDKPALENQSVLLLDLEGTDGQHAVLDDAGACDAESMALRRKAVGEYFPRIAYCASNAVFVVSNEDLTVASYADACRKFTQAAVDDVVEVGHPPALFLIQNKAPLESPLPWGIDKFTEAFKAAHTATYTMLEEHFSSVWCVRMPDWTTSNEGTRGAELGASVLKQLRKKLREACTRVPMRFSYEVWLSVLGDVVDHVSEGGLVHLFKVVENRLCGRGVEHIAYRAALHMSSALPLRASGDEDLRASVEARFTLVREYAVRALALLQASSTGIELADAQAEKNIRAARMQQLQELWRRIDERLQPCLSLDRQGNVCGIARGAHGRKHARHKVADGQLTSTWTILGGRSYAGDFVEGESGGVDEGLFEEAIMRSSDAQTALEPWLGKADLARELGLHLARFDGKIDVNGMVYLSPA